MEHKKWEPGTLYAKALRDITNEHNALYDDWKKSEHRVMETLDENNRLDRELDEARQALKSVPAPVTDEQIGVMAAAGRNAYCAPSATWEDAIRAALAAIGPQYCPADVAFNSRVPALEAKIARQRKNLHQLYAANAELRDHIDVENTNAAAVNDLLVRVQSLTAELDAARVAPTDAQVEALARVLRAAYWNEDRWDDQSHSNRGDWLGVARAAFTHIGATERPKGLPVKVRWDCTNKEMYDAWNAAPDMATVRDYLAAHAVIDVPAGVPSDEALVKIAIDAYNSGPECGFGDGMRRAIAALAPYLREPVGCPSDPLVESVTHWFRAEAEARERIAARIAALEGES